MPHRPLALLASAALTGCLVVAPALPGVAAPALGSATTYANCTAIHRVYSGGIARSGVKYNKTPSGNRALKGKVKVSSALYAANAKSDRDKDGIACELS